MNRPDFVEIKPLLERENISIRPIHVICCDISYFYCHVLPLLASRLLHKIECRLAIGICCDKEFEKSIIHCMKLYCSELFDNVGIYFVRLDKRTNLDHSLRYGYYKTVRYDLAKRLLYKYKCGVFITDADCLWSKSPTKEQLSYALPDSNVVWGSVQDLFKYKAFTNVESYDYPWRVIKAGYSFFPYAENGIKALKMVNQLLFNYMDKIPPAVELRMFTSYYGDQVVLRYVIEYLYSVGLTSQYCIGFVKDHMISFRDDGDSSLLIPPRKHRSSSNYLNAVDESYLFLDSCH